MDERNRVEIFDEDIRLLLEIGGNVVDFSKWFLEKKQSITILFKGAYFNINKIGNKNNLQLSGEIIKNSMPDKWKKLENFLRENIGNVDGKKDSIMDMVKIGLDSACDWAGDFIGGFF